MVTISMEKIAVIQDRVSEVQRTLQNPGLDDKIRANQISITTDALRHINNSISTAIPKRGSWTQEKGRNLAFGQDDAIKALKTIRTYSHQ